MKDTGKFVVSLDFELLWGVRDKKTPQTYGDHILGVRECLPKIIDLFEAFQIKGTFATVGFLFASSKQELLAHCPAIKPQYLNPLVSPYNGHLELIGENEQEDKMHYAPSLVLLLKKHPNQEIATHTFSHYYCLEDGQTLEDFKQDLLAAIAIAKTYGIAFKSLIFPKNQSSRAHLKVLSECGITSYRGSENTWYYQPVKGVEDTLPRRVFRLLDTYLNIAGHQCASIQEIKASKPYNIPSSRLLRPYASRLRLLEGVRLKRIQNSMTYAAQHKKVFHLWWHPHNFGVNQKENIRFLKKILEHYQLLNRQYGFESITMSELSTQIDCL